MVLAAQEVFHLIEYTEAVPAHDLLDVRGVLDAHGLVAHVGDEGDLHHAPQEGRILDHLDDQNLAQGHQDDQVQGHQKDHVQGRLKGHIQSHQKGHAQGHQKVTFKVTKTITIKVTKEVTFKITKKIEK